MTTEPARIHVSPEELAEFPVTETTLTSPEGLSLSVRVTNPGRATAVVLSHGFGSDKHSRGRFDRIALEYARLGHTVAAYDFSGFGRSSDAPILPARLQSDLRTVVEYLREQGAEEIALHGHSLGTAISVLAGPALPEVRAYVLTGALSGPIPNRNPGGALSPEQLERLKNGESVLVEDQNDNGRTHFELPAGGMPDPYEGLTQQHALSALPVPVLVVHGDEDDLERKLLSVTQEGFEYLPAGSQLVVIRGADHSFIGAFNDVVDHATRWLLKHFPARSISGR